MTTAEDREALAEALPKHQSWCHGEAHAECCGAGDCDCGVADSLDRLLPVVDAIAQRRARAAKAEVWRLVASWVGPPFAEEFRDRADALEAE